MKKNRLDVILVERGLVESRSLAQRLVMAGQIKVEDQTIYKSATMVPEDARIDVIEMQRYVSRGAEKLFAGLQEFQRTELDGCVCADVGASTGGFTDCLLDHGALRVYAIDVGEKILHWKLRNDPRVVVMESTNVRYLEKLPEPVDLVVIDVSFISLELVLPVIKNWLKHPIGEVIALVKPQFEAGRKEAAQGKGVIRDLRIHRKVLEKIMHFAVSQGFEILGATPSPILGPKGNREFLLHFGMTTQRKMDIQIFLDQILEMQ